MKNVTMKRFIYFFIFFLLLTLSLFFIMNRLASETVEKSLINSSKGQIEYTYSILEDLIAAASLYVTQLAADKDVRFYKNQIQEMNDYDYQMKKNEIGNQLDDILISSHALDSIGIYWRADDTFITTSHDPLAKVPFRDVTVRGWKTVNNSLYYFAVYPFIQQSDEPAPLEYVVGVQLKTDYLKNLLENAIGDENAKAFYWVDETMLWSNKKVDEKIVAAAKTMATSRTDDTMKYDYHSSDGDYYILTKHIPLINTDLVTYTQMSNVLEPLNRNRQLFFVSILAILLVGLFVIYTFYRNFYRYVYLLQKKFHHIEQGNYGTRITQQTKNEFSYLFKSFNHMVTEIQGLFASLKTETELRRNAELKQLQAQINPHFLYNSLFFIMTVARSSPDAVTQMSKHLAEYYRYMTRLDKDHVTIASEVELAKHYLIIMSLSKQMVYEISLPNELENYSIKPLMIQPIVENAIQHGIEERQGAHRVRIAIEKQQDGILITIDDDGKGLDQQQINKLERSIQHQTPPEGTKGIGLWNVNHRLKNTYSDASYLRFQNNEWGGLSVCMYIELQSEKGG